MARTTARRRGRQRGQIEQLPSGSLRVTVYAGTDPLTKRRHYLREVIPAGPTAAAEAEKAPRRLGVQVDEKRSPQTSATVEQSATPSPASLSATTRPPPCAVCSPPARRSRS